MRRWILLIGLMILVMPLRAQDTAPSDYRLRVPSAEEYLRAVPGIMAQRQIDVGDSRSRFTVFEDTITREIFARYITQEDIGWETLLATYDAIGIGTGFFFTRRDWNTEIIMRWLRQNAVDLSTVQNIRFADYIIRVIPRDYDADGRDEYVLDVSKGGEIDRQSCIYNAEYVDYLVLQQHDTVYHLIDTGLPWIGQGFGRPFDRDFGLMELDFGDMNDDGFPEWILAFGGISAGMSGNPLNAGRLIILSWRDGRLEDLLPSGDNFDERAFYEEYAGMCHGPLPRDVVWDFSNIDDDPALEIQQDQIAIDQWGCENHIIRLFDWDSETSRYVFGGQHMTYVRSDRHCLWREGEIAMWRTDYVNAIRFYRGGLLLDRLQVPDSTYPFNFEIYASPHAIEQELNQYVRLRLALAYMLLGQEEHAAMVLQPLALEDPGSELMGAVIPAVVQAFENRTSPLAPCVAAYTVFTNLGQYDSHFWYFGDVIVPPEPFYYPYEPTRASCYAPELIQQTLSQVPLSTTRTPIEHLTSLGLDINSIVRADLNRDGVDEWLVWLQAPMNPIFFVDTGEHYAVSYPSINSYRDSIGVSTWTLPDNLGEAVIYINYERFHEMPPWGGLFFSGGFYGDVDCSQINDTLQYAAWFRMWRMDGTRLIPIMDERVCESTLEGIFPNGPGSTVFQGIYSVWPEESDGTRHEEIAYPVEYHWDSISHTFVSTHVPTPTPTWMPTPEPPPAVESYIYAEYAFDAGDYAAVVRMTEGIAVTDDPNFDFSRIYLRAIALEALGRADEALAEYVAIYEAAPDSAWGMLAGLHIERVE